MFHPQGINTNLLLYLILEYLKNPTSMQMVAELLQFIADFKYAILPIQLLHILVFIESETNSWRQQSLTGVADMRMTI